jgi:hypothetical protein
MLPGTNSSSSEFAPLFTGQNFSICILTVGLCMLTFAMPAQASDNAVRAYQVPPTTRINTSAIPNLPAEQPAPHSRWSLLPKDFAQAPNSALLNFAPVLARSAEPAVLAAYSLPRPEPAAPFAAANANGSSLGSGHGYWLALGIAGVIVAAAGVVAYAGSRSNAFFCGGSNPSGGCNEVRTTGLVLMPVGAAMAVTGFVMRFRH